jgi:EAL domain-containing protein (putative c-di-GMP-specific phosphodiesterase class I)
MAMPYQPTPESPIRLLLVTEDAAARYAATAAAQALGASLYITGDINEAIALLLRPVALFTHVLAPSTLSPADIDALAGMVDEVTPALTRLLLLNAEREHGPTELAVPTPDATGITAAIHRTTVVPMATKPALTAEELRLALHEGQLRMRFQPVVDAATHRPVGLEALARLHHRAYGILRPSDFLPVAVESNQERTLTGIAASRTLQELRPLPGLEGLRLALNVPISVLLQPYAAPRAAELCAVAGIGPDRMVIEVIETHELPDLVAVGRAVECWRDAGFDITIDDAGPPLPHWRQMLELPFSGVKLDASLAADTPQATALAADIAAAAHQRGLYVVAEGIEDAASAVRMASIGARALQGFYFSRPLPARAVPAWLALARAE